ncbi:hypothetical protein FQA39_LY16295 [Lamprigera yunnana]|nr:hypothetical protein FQA39_LY16295 [Lamprigera yunnana]
MWVLYAEQHWSKTIDLKSAVESLYEKLGALEFDKDHEVIYGMEKCYTVEQCKQLSGKYKIEGKDTPKGLRPEMPVTKFVRSKAQPTSTRGKVISLDKQAQPQKSDHSENSNTSKSATSEELEDGFDKEIDIDDVEVNKNLISKDAENIKNPICRAIKEHDIDLLELSKELR